MFTLHDRAFGNLAEAVKASERGDHSRAQFHFRVARRQLRQWSAQLAEQHRRLQLHNQRIAREYAERVTGDCPF